MERIHPKPRLPGVRKRLVEADGCFLTREVDPFTTRNSQRFFNEHAADVATAKRALAARHVRNACRASAAIAASARRDRHLGTAVGSGTRLNGLF